MKYTNKIICLSVSAALTAMAGQAAGSGFQLMEQNASGLGNAYAGQAAAAENASTIFFNPAGMTRLRDVRCRARSISFGRHRNSATPALRPEFSRMQQFRRK